MTEFHSTRDELESKIRRLIGMTELERTHGSTNVKSPGAAVGFLAALMAYAWGRRRGRRGR